MVPEDVIAEIKRRVDLVAVVSRLVKLKKTGQNYVGLCPFHNEKSPSFNVRPSEGFFYCFGCRATGDAFEFLQRSGGRSFMDVLVDLAATTGVPLPEQEENPAEKAVRETRQGLLRALQHAQTFFRTRLVDRGGELAQSYLRDVRKLDADTVDTFGFGYGGASDQGLLNFLREHRIDEAVAVEAGILATGDRGRYDFFRQRITLPIRNHKGDIVTFTGRIFGEHSEGKPKYVNGPQSPVYDKGSTLFGLFEAQAALRQGKAAVLVEGPLDVIAVTRASGAVAIAPCGTSLTPRHIEEISKRTERIIVCLDADGAGRAAARKAVLMMLRANLQVHLAALPDKDPDALVQAGRGEELARLLAAAPTALDASIQLARTTATGSLQGRLAAIEELLPVLAAPGRDLVKREAVKAAALALGEDEAVLLREVEGRGAARLQQALGGGTKPRAAAPSSAPTATPTPPAVVPTPRAPRPTQRQRWPESEVLLARALLCHPVLAPRALPLRGLLESRELVRFVDALVDALVRFHDQPPAFALKHVGVSPSGELVRIADDIRLRGGESRFMTEAHAHAVLDELVQQRVDRGVLRGELQALQVILGGNHHEGADLRRLLLEQQALVESIRSLDAPVAQAALPPPPMAVAFAALAAAPSPAVETTDDGDRDDDPPWAGGAEEDPWSS